ncbi:serine/threonine protein kinase [Colletotrichum karsti]|uniref:Serine/threonine protein kinase n=1 Tax=Colletotrichum karsti TaxID=1095194 RepID=A0A9P6LJJ0_9PEZI|nr:serine/threonine protein kinase [Colletotrichum karsti]KAF9874935.1 serine/threonine protein kinase [Colletotrichum karsti]
MPGTPQPDPVDPAPPVNKVETATIKQKGELVAVGATSFVELLPDGDILKRPFPSNIHGNDRRREITTEAYVYDRLGPHRYLLQKKKWDPETCSLTLEYMPNGTLADYLAAHPDVSLERRKQWAVEAAGCVQLLHLALIYHCDIGPQNFLLDDRLGLKIIDFSGSSTDGSPTGIEPGFRYHDELSRGPSFKLDIFSLGSTMYFIMAGKHPFAELEDDEVIARFRARDFPDLTDVPLASVIQKCWSREVESVDDVINLLTV